jgi:hypothetical protein
MPGGRPGSAKDVEHEFTLPARVVEVTRDGPREEDPDTDEILPPAPAATDDGTPVNIVRRPAPDPR